MAERGRKNVQDAFESRVSRGWELEVWKYVDGKYEEHQKMEHIHMWISKDDFSFNES